jgi:hypothetical protein
LGAILAKNFRPETFGFLTNQPTVDAGESAKIGTREQLLQLLKLFVLNFAVQPLRWPKGGHAHESIISATRDRKTNVLISLVRKPR